MTHQPHTSRAFHRLLLNTTLAAVSTSFLWMSLSFWVYLETRSVMTTSLLGGSYLLLVAIAGVPFGTLLDRFRKYSVMFFGTVVTTVAFLLAGLVYVLVPEEQLRSWQSPLFWCFAGLLLIGAVVASLRQLGLSTSVTILVPAEERDKANGLVGTVSGLGMAVNAVAAGLAVGYLGMSGTLMIGISATVLAAGHYILFVRIPEKEIVHDENLPKAVDFAGAWRGVRAVPGLLGLVLFSTFNNLLGGVFMALLDPYGLTVMSVQAWGIAYGVVSFSFIVGGIAVTKFGLGSKPVRTILLANVVAWLVGMGFVIRESVILLLIGMFVYMAVIPVAEAAEQTVMQTVVPVEMQGRVFGFAQSVEVAAAPVTSMLIGPIAQFWLIPYMNGPGEQQLSWLLGTGDARGIALVFILAALIGLVVTVAAFGTKSYQTLGATYAERFEVQAQVEAR